MAKDDVTWNEVHCTLGNGVVFSIGKDYIKFSFMSYIRRILTLNEDVDSSTFCFDDSTGIISMNIHFSGDTDYRSFLKSIFTSNEISEMITCVYHYLGSCGIYVSEDRVRFITYLYA